MRSKCAAARVYILYVYKSCIDYINLMMRLSIPNFKLISFLMLIFLSSTCLADDNLFKQARTLQRAGKFDQAIEAYVNYLSQPISKDDIKSGTHLATYTDALLQLMNTYQSKGDPEACISALDQVYKSSPILQKECLRDYCSVLGYALSRTEDMKKAEEIMLKALTLPLYHATPERFFRDYAYAAAVFYSNPDYHEEVVNWCQEALVQAQSCTNTSGQQWVLSMLGSLYKRDGNLNEALELFHDSITQSKAKNDELGILNSLNSLVDLFLYWDIPEYANLYANEAVSVEMTMTASNPMVSAQVYINKGRALQQLGVVDSISLYIEKARTFCEVLPYNSGMVDVNLLNGIYLTEMGGDSVVAGIGELEHVTRTGTAANKARAYHQLAKSFLKSGQINQAENILDSLYLTLNYSDSPINILHLDYKPILDHYLKTRNHVKAEQYVELMLQEQQTFRKRSLNYNLVESIVDLQTGKRLQELKILQLKRANERLWLLIIIALSAITIAVTVTLLLYQRKRHIKQMRHADENIASMVQKLNQLNQEKESITQKVNEFLNNKDKRRELETLTPFILKEDGELKFRECFELLYPLFLHRLREKVPSITRREELLSMLIVLKQDNKQIADLLAIAPRSVLMLRHRFRQKIGMNTEFSLENFIEDLLD